MSLSHDINSTDYSFARLILDTDDQELFGVIINYLRLSQFDLATKTINELFNLSPLRIIRILRSIFSRYYPTDWILETVLPPITLLAIFCADEYERLWSHVIKEIAVVPSHPLNQNLHMTPVNMLGFIDFDLLTIEVLDGLSLPVQDGYAVSVVISMGSERFQTSFTNSPSSMNPDWAGFYSVADNSNRLQANELNPQYADETLDVLVIQNRIDDLKNRLVSGKVAQPSPIASGKLTLDKFRSKQEHCVILDLKKMVGGVEAKSSGGKLRIFLKWGRSGTSQVGKVPEKVRFRLRSDQLLAETLHQQRKLGKEYLSTSTIREIRQKLRMSSDDFCLSVSSDYSSIGIALLTPLTSLNSKTFVRQTEGVEENEKFGRGVAEVPDFLNTLRPLVPIEPYRINDVLLEKFIVYPYPDSIAPKLLPAVQSENLHTVSDSLFLELHNICTALPQLGHPIAVILTQHWHAIIIGHTHSSLQTAQFLDQTFHRFKDVKKSTFDSTKITHASAEANLGGKKLDNLPAPLVLLAKHRKMLWESYNIRVQRLYCKLVCEAALSRKMDAFHLTIGSLLSMIYVLFERLRTSPNDASNKETTFGESSPMVALFFNLAHSIYHETHSNNNVLSLRDISSAIHGLEDVDGYSAPKSRNWLPPTPSFQMVLMILSFFLRYFPSSMNVTEQSSKAQLELVEQFVTSFPGLAYVGANNNIITEFSLSIDELVDEEIRTSNSGNANSKALGISSITPTISQIAVISNSFLSASLARKVQYFCACFSSLARHSALVSTSEQCLAEAIALLDSQIVVVHLMNRVSQNDFLPFFFHRFEAQLNMLENDWISNESNSSICAQKCREAHQTFLSEYYAFCRHTDYNIYDFVISSALRYIVEGDFDKANTLLLPFPQLRVLVVIAAFLRLKDFSDKYNMIMQIWRHYKYFSLYSTNASNITPTYLSIFDSLGDGQFVMWAHRLTFYVELLEVLIVVDKETTKAEFSLEFLEQKKSLLLDRLASSLQESWPLIVYEEGLFSLDPNVFITMFETSPYYNHMGIMANHDMNFVRMFHAIRLMFALVSASSRPNEEKRCSPIFDIIEHILLNSLDGQTRYQINCLDKLFCIAIMRCYAARYKYEHENSLLCPPHRLPPIMQFLKKLGTKLCDELVSSNDTVSLGYLKSISKLIEGFDDLIWRIAVLKGANEIDGYIYLNSVMSSMDELPVVLLRRSFMRGGVDAQFKHDENHDNTYSSPGTEERWYSDRATFVNLPDITVIDRLNLVSLQPNMDAFVHSLDLLFVALDESLFAARVNLELNQKATLFEIYVSNARTKLSALVFDDAINHTVQQYYLAVSSKLEHKKSNKLDEVSNLLNPQSTYKSLNRSSNVLEYSSLLAEIPDEDLVNIWELREQLLGLTPVALSRLIDEASKTDVNPFKASLASWLSCYSSQSYTYKQESDNSSLNRLVAESDFSEDSKLFEEGVAVDVSSVALPWILELSRDRLACIQKLVAPVLACFHVLLSRSLSPQYVEDVVSSFTPSLNLIKDYLPELTAWVKHRFMLINLVLGVLHKYSQKLAPFEKEISTIFDLLFTSSDYYDQVAICKLCRLLIDLESSEASYFNVLSLLDAHTDASCEDSQMLSEEVYHRILNLPSITDDERMHYVIRMRDHARASNYLVQFLDNCTEVQPLKLTILKLLSVITQQKINYTVPHYLYGMTFVKSWPPNSSISPAIAATLEYLQAFLNIYAEIKASVPLSVSLYAGWRDFERALDTRFVTVCVSLFYDYMIPSNLALKLINLYSNTRSKAVIISATVKSVMFSDSEDSAGGGGEYLKALNETQEWLNINFILENLKCGHFNPYLDISPELTFYGGASFNGRIEAIRKLDLLLQLYPQHFVRFATLIVRRLYHAPTRLLILDFMFRHTTLGPDTISIVDGKDYILTEISKEDREWLLHSLAGIKMIVKFPIETQLEFVKEYYSPCKQMYLMLEHHLSIGATQMKNDQVRWNLYWQYLMDILYDPEFQPYIFGGSSMPNFSPTMASFVDSDKTVIGLEDDPEDRMPDLIMHLIRSLLCGSTGDKFSDLLSRKKPSWDMLNACPKSHATDLAVIAIINQLSRYLSNIKISHAVLNRFVIFELLEWLSTKLQTWPMEIRIKYFGAAEITSSVNSLLYKIYGFGIDVSIRDLLNPSLGYELRRRLLVNDKVNLVQRVMLEVEGLAQQDFEDYMDHMKKESAKVGYC